MVDNSTVNQGFYDAEITIPDYTNHYTITEISKNVAIMTPEQANSKILKISEESEEIYKKFTQQKCTEKEYNYFEEFFIQKILELDDLEIGDDLRELRKEVVKNLQRYIAELGQVKLKYKFEKVDKDELVITNQPPSTYGNDPEHNKQFNEIDVNGLSQVIKGDEQIPTQDKQNNEMHKLQQIQQDVENLMKGADTHTIGNLESKMRSYIQQIEKLNAIDVQHRTQTKKWIEQKFDEESRRRRKTGCCGIF